MTALIELVARQSANDGFVESMQEFVGHNAIIYAANSRYEGLRGASRSLIDYLVTHLPAAIQERGV